jgi:hypothetical protein
VAKPLREYKIRKVRAKMVPTGKPEQTILEWLDQRVVNITEFGLLKNHGKRKNQRMMREARKWFSQIYLGPYTLAH